MSDTAFRVYDALLRCYPAEYRRVFGAQMRQTFLDHCEDVTRSGGNLDLHFWVAAIADEVPNILRQRVASVMPGGGFLKVTVWKLLLAAAVFPPLFAFFYAALVHLSLALPHPSVGGITAALALTGLLVIPGILGMGIAYLLASALASCWPHRTPSRRS